MYVYVASTDMKNAHTGHCEGMLWHLNDTAYDSITSSNAGSSPLAINSSTRRCAEYRLTS